MKKIPSKLYHYCSIDSFFHIINSKSIWMSNSAQMNDSNENIWIEKYFDIIKEYFVAPQYKKLLKESLDMYKWNSNPPFVFCLSGRKDLLSQWRAYSQDGMGVSIGFNTKHLNIQRDTPSPSVYARNTLGLAKVEYLNYSQKDKVLKMCKDIRSKFDTAESEYDTLMLSVELGLSLVNWALVFKNGSFKEEKEYRIIHTPSDSYEENLDGLSDLQFRLEHNRIITYHSLCFNSKFNSHLINEIVLGPKCKMSIDEIEQFLMHNGLEKTKVIISKSTYR